MTPGRALTCLVTIFAAACGAESAVTRGEALLSDARVSTAASNVFTCATCHDLDGTQSAKPGYVLDTAARRPSFWGGNVSDLRSAVNQCLVDFMRSQPLSESDERGRAIYTYLSSVAGDAPAEALPFTIEANIVNVPSADATRGAEVYDGACAGCHGAPHTGQGRISSEASLVPDDTFTSAMTLSANARLIVIEKVRHGKYFSIGGIMPPFSKETLSDAGLGDLLAYLEAFDLPPQ